MRDVAVVGATMLKFGRYPAKDVVTLASEAAIGAIKDAGCSIKDVEIVVSGNLYQSNAMIGQRVIRRLAPPACPSSTSPTPALPAPRPSARRGWPSLRALTMWRWRSAANRWARWAFWALTGRRE